MPFKVVIICEKQNQVKIFKKAYGLSQVKQFKGVGAAHYDNESNMCVVGLSGHLLELRPPEFYEPSLRSDKQGWNIEALPVIPPGNRWPLMPKRSKTTKERNRVDGLLAGIEWALVKHGVPGEIAIAVDNDKEGELLGWETLEYFKVVDHPNKTRLFYSAIAEKAMKKAFDDRVDAEPWKLRYLAGLARQYADWLIGMTVTMGMSVENKGFIAPYDPLNSGRVVFAICYLIYKRYDDIKNFKPQDYYTESVKFKAAGGTYEGKVLYPQQMLDPMLGKVTNKIQADKVHAHIKQAGSGKIVRYDQEKKKTPPPIGFHRTGLDRHMIRKFGLDLGDIDKALQSLYDEKGLATYPRVDVKHLDENMHSQMPDNLAAMAKNLSEAVQLNENEQALYARAFQIADVTKKSKMFKKGIEEGEAHHAIIPTAGVNDLKSLTRNEFLVYRELVDRLLIQFLPDYEYSSTIIETQVGKITCKTTGATPLKKGWKGLSQDMEEEADEDAVSGTLPIMAMGEDVNLLDAMMKTNTTAQPKLYTIDEILGDLENPKKYVENEAVMKKIKKLQIGTDGTRQGHITSLEHKGLAFFQTRAKSKKIKEIHPTGKLISLIRAAPGYLKHPETSAYWEDASNEIQAGNMTLDSFIAKQAKMMHRFVDDLKAGKFKFKGPTEASAKKCQTQGCHGYMFLRKPKKKDFKVWGCGACGVSHFDKDGEVGKKMGGERKGSGPTPDWQPPKGASKRKCTECDDGYAYHKKLDGKSWTMWECTGCKSGFFDDKGALGKKIQGKGKK